MCYIHRMNTSELRRYLKKMGCTFETHKGGSGHVTVLLNGKKTQMPTHGSNKELGTGLVRKIKKDLGLE
jgi:mRNA interferase HicA